MSTLLYFVDLVLPKAIVIVEFSKVYAPYLLNSQQNVIILWFQNVTVDVLCKHRAE